MNEVLFDVDYSVDNSKYKYVAEMSFTYLHWKLIELMKSKAESEFTLSSIDNSQVKQIAFNILPGCNTILHHIVKKQKFIKELYAISKGDDKFDPPFLCNLEGATPLDLCFIL